MSKTATLYRMVTDEHICPYGLKAKDLLQREGFNVDDHLLKTKQETESFKKEEGVKTTPQAFIDGKRVGGYDDLREHFGKTRHDAKAKKPSYQPVIAVFASSLAMALALSWRLAQGLPPAIVLELFVSLSMVVLAILKLRDLYAFTNQFLSYDLLSQRWLPYAFIYPFVEGLAGLAMLASVGVQAAGLAAAFIGAEGALSVFKAVFVEKRELKCACVGGNSNVPLGFVSLLENLMMIGMGLWALLG